MMQRTMARLFISNRRDRVEQIRGQWSDAGLAASMLPGSLPTVIAMKRRIEHDNVHHAREDAKDAWAAGTGTYADFAGNWGADALRYVADRFDAADPLAVRETIFGHYALAIRRGGRAFVLCDAVCSYAVYFTCRGTGSQGGDFVIATDLADLRSLPWLEHPIDEAGALHAAFHGERGLASRSVVPGVSSVRGHQFVALDEAAGGWNARLVDGPPLRQRSMPASPEEGLDDYRAQSDLIFGALNSVGPVGVNVTGGFDSRLVVASAAKHGLAGHLLYGRGDSAMTYTQRRDLAAARAIAATLDARLRVMDWTQGTPHRSAERHALMRRHGFKLPYGATSGVAASFDGGIAPYPRLQLAGYGPGFVNKRVWAWSGNVTPGDFAATYAEAYTDVFASSPAREAYLERMDEDLVDLAQGAGIAWSPDGFDVAAATALWAFAKASKEAFNIQAFNEYCYYLAPHFTTAMLLRILALAPEWRRGDRFQVALVAHEYAPLLDVPVFSGVRPFRLDKTALTLTPVDPRRDWSLLRRASGALADRREARADRTARFRRAHRAELLADPGEGVVDHEVLATKDLRAVFRYLVARDMFRAL